MIEERGAQLAGWVDDRLGLAHWTKKTLDKIFPDHWSFMIGEIAMYSFVIVILTGVYLTFFFVPSLKEVTYHGSYAPLRGVRMSEAYRSTLNLSLSVRGGLVIRQMHHWAADIFIGAIVVHMCRIFFTGAYRRPRELNWIIGTSLLFLAIINGFLGYSLPDDLVSGTGVRIAFSIFLSIPVVGTYLAFFFFGGNYPGTAFDFRFFILHVLIIPAIIAALLGAHLAMVWHQKHTQFRGGGATERNVVGSPVWPTYALKSQGFFFMTFGVIAALGGLAQINPIWLYGPYLPYKATYLVQPDWYMGWLDGALRLMPSWETTAFGHMIPNAFWPAIVLPGITTMVLFSWPFIEARFTKENLVDHHLLDRPRDRPVRTAIGVAVLSFYCVLFLASATDLLANFFSVSLNTVLWSLRIILFALPPVVGGWTYLLCKDLSKAEHGVKRKRPTIIVRSPEGGYEALPTKVHPGYEEREELEPVKVPAMSLAELDVSAGAEEEHVPLGASAPGSRGGGVLQAPRSPVPPPPGGGLRGRFGRPRPGRG